MKTHLPSAWKATSRFSLFVFAGLMLFGGHCRADSITLDLFDPEYQAGGQVSVNGYVATTVGTIERIQWDWADGTTNESWFPASHQYQTNGTYLIQVTAFSSVPETRTESVTVVVTNVLATNPTCITLLLGVPDYLSCGSVSVNGYVSASAGAVERMIWDWGDETTSQSWFPAQHSYPSNGSYTISVTAYGTVGPPRTENQAANVSNIEPACANTFRVYPPTVFLKQGKTNQNLTIDLRAPDGRPISFALADASFQSDQPGLVQVTDDGVVSSTGLGSAVIEVSLLGQPRTVAVPVIAGEIRVEPAILLLSMDTPTNGQISLKAFFADGSPVNLAGRSVVFGGGNAVAGVDAQGIVTPLRPPAVFWESPYLNATLDGMPARNACVVRVTQTNLNLTMADYVGEFITVRVASQFGPHPYGALMTQLQLNEVLDTVFRMERRFCGTTPNSGGQQFFVLDPGVDTDGTVPCGLSGNPIRLGAGIYNLRSCFGGADWIQWGVMGHELAHNFLSQSSFADFVSGLSNPAAYTEGLATALSAFSLEEIITDAPKYGLSANTLASLRSLSVPLAPEQIRHIHYQVLTNYEANPDYAADFTADLVDAILFKLGDQYGPGFFFRFMSVFYPPDEIFLSYQNETQRLTFWVAACSAAARADLRARFRNTWGYPVDDAFFDQMLPRLQQRAAQRDPVIKEWFVASNHFHLAAHAIPDTEYQIQRSSDFVHWTNISTNTASNYALEWADTIQVQATSRFYRVIY